MHWKLLSLVLIALGFGAMSGCKGLLKTGTKAPPDAGYKKTASGLQYKVLKEGTGKRPIATSPIVVHYRGLLLNGTVFESTEQTGPATYSLNRMPPGWIEGVQLMREGAQYRFIMPPPLGFGNRRRSALVEPNATVVYEIALLRVD